MPKELKPDQGTDPAGRELVITRIFNAPRELVFEVFTDPEHLIKWWGPHGCTVISCEADPRAGGTWCISMRTPRALPQFVNRHPISPEAGFALSRQHPNSRDVIAQEHEWIVERQQGVYQEVVKPERLVFTYAFEDNAGRPLHQTVVTVTFADENGRTKLTLHQAIFESVSARDDHVRGWTEALEHLTEYLMRA
ncbi:MAG: SRPBCC domain-containing protein [Deltaproteobacteria bacterium]|nr:SRPBCC domain-containing protein [Deltaproteobacteria bacterium]